MGRSPDEHGVLREMICGGPRPLMCRLCKGEQDCPYIADRSSFRVRVSYRDPTDPVPPLEQRSVATGADGMPAQARHPGGLLVAAALAWLVAVGLVLWFWVVERPTWAEVGAVLGVKVVVFVFVVVGVPLVRLTWSHHGGRFRGSP
ncbi:MAG: hypothetical protein ACKO04_07750 [Actinomycetes bacterium]